MVRKDHFAVDGVPGHYVYGMALRVDDTLEQWLEATWGVGAQPVGDPKFGWSFKGNSAESCFLIQVY